MKKTAIAVIFLLFSGLGQAEPDVLAQKINQVLQAFGENINMGILVEEAKSGSILYQKNADRFFTPASTQKLLTAFAAIASLGPDFSYRTQLFADYKKIKNNSLNDNLYLLFSGDPTLTLTQFDLLLNSLLQAGIFRIKGDIVIDDTAFDDMPMSPGTSWEDEDFCFGAPVSALIINRNCVQVILKPALKVEEPAILELPDYPQSMQFENLVTTGSADATNCQVKVKRSGQATYTLTGCVKALSSPQLIERAIDNPRDNAVFLLKSLLTKNEITLKGNIVFKPVDSTAKPFALQLSMPLKAMIAVMLKESDNILANALFKTMGAVLTQKPGSFKNGSLAVRKVLAEAVPLTIAKNALLDGSGASRYNFLTPAQVVTLLHKIFILPKAADFIASLAINGVDGTLKDRMKAPSLRGKLFAKTGTQTAVTALSGYIKTNSNKTLIFSFMINGFVNPSAKYKGLEDKLCQVLVEAG
ncbi:MAG: D-alanyl-D-alanine carboxypeptidase/D-alanyl-D-alanine-endopeptidase [Tatlockia sp.]|jgi:D-alanyl-D-alanine carboxypeptidase/D-alanyl-D-alanine-endopeptidase (penicillin-binding protein 4)